MGKIALAALWMFAVAGALSCSSTGTGTGTGGGAGGGTGGSGGSGGGNSACAGGLISCGTFCRDGQADASNCGACGKVCGPGMVCNRGTCGALPDDCVAAGGCAPGYFCEPTTKKCNVGCRLSTECPSSATCELTVCQCPVGQHVCGQSCVPSTSPNSCGTSCAGCPGVAHGSGVCTNAACELQCDTGYALSAGKCEPVGAGYKPNVMFLVDKSGSMNFAVNDQLAPCTPGCNTSGKPACAAGCPTRLQALKGAMSTFVTAHSTVAWLGMAIYPTASGTDSCGATTSTDVKVPLASKKTDLDADLSASAMAINTQILALTVGGGTPTGGSMTFLGSYAPLLDPDPTVPRADFVVLLTDGVPNCNANNANDCNTPALCKCTLTPATACAPSSFCKQGCLDKDSSAAAISALLAKNVRTIVIGLGAETAMGDGPDSLNAMAEAGGVPRKCPNGTDAECGAGNTCKTTTKVCSTKYYQASSESELGAALNDALLSLPP